MDNSLKRRGLIGRRDFLRRAGAAIVAPFVTASFVTEFANSDRFLEWLDKVSPNNQHEYDEVVTGCKKYLKERYGMEFEIGITRKSIKEWGVSEFRNSLTLPDIKDMFKGLLYELDKYPNGMLKRIGQFAAKPFTIHFGNYLSDKGNKISAGNMAGVTITDPGQMKAERIIFSNYKFFTSDFPSLDNEDNFHLTINHELFHLLFSQLSINQQRSYLSEWNKISRHVGFGGKDVSAWLSEFHRPYGAEDVEEDMAEFASYIMRRSFLENINKTTKVQSPDPSERDRILGLRKQKFELLKRILLLISTTINPSKKDLMDDKFWEKLLSELVDNP